MTPVSAVLAAESTSTSVGPGILGFFVVAFLVVALVVLYRSMRKQMRKVDFDTEGVTDEERMRRHRDDPGRAG